MSFCEKFRPLVKKVVNEITKEVDEIATDVVLPITGAIIKLQADPGVQAIEALIPGAAPVVAAFNTAIDAFANIATDAEAIIHAPDTKTKWILFITDLKKIPAIAANGVLDKIAGIVTGILDGNKQTENVYDLAVMASIATTKLSTQAA